MKIVIAPDAFKESMTAFDVAVAMEKGVRKVIPDATIHKMPIADGGEGTVEALIDALGGKKITATVTGPLGEPMACEYGMIDGKIAVIEVAAVCGLGLIEDAKRNPLKTTSYGVGELIIHALDRGIHQFIIGLGGSGTNDGGIGMAQALGADITNTSGESVPFGGEGLQEVAHISLEKLDARLADCTFEIASDVTNPLLGEQGATAVYGPQKGADQAMVTILDQAMTHYATILQRDIEMDVADEIGAGAAGGLGAACLVFLNANIRPGIEVIAKHTGLADMIKDATLVLTGEGKMDDQTSYGKAVTGVAQIAKRYGVPVVAITGANQTTTDEVYERGVTAIFSLVNGPMTLDQAMENGAMLTENITENVLRLFTYT